MMGRKIALLALTAIYTFLLFGRVWSNQLTHPGLNSDREVFIAAVRWHTMRDIAILTGFYALAVFTLFNFKRGS